MSCRGDFAHLDLCSSYTAPSTRWLASVELVESYSLGGELRNTVDEANAFDQFTESLDRRDAVPMLLCFERELQHHGERAVLGEGTLDPLGAVAQCGERGLNRVGGANVQLMLTST